MTRDEAITITQMILNSWAKPDWTDGQTEAYVNALVPYDADYMTEAVADAHKTVGFRPSFAELIVYYRYIKEHKPRRDDTPPRPQPKYTKQIPQWVKEWICARYLYAAFGKDQDMRRFTQQQDWRDPADPLMPPGAWANEAATLGDGRAWTVFRNGQ